MLDKPLPIQRSHAMTQADPSIDFSLTRTFDAPRELVFQTMTETAHLRKWWGPPGCTVEVLRNEARPGGVFHYTMRFAPGVEMHGRFDWIELAAPARLVFVNGFADAAGNRIRHMMSPGWPLEVQSTVSLEEEGGKGGKTRMTLVSTPKDASEIERQTFKAGHAVLAQGFGGMYEVYERYLATL
jgi:uncharacterized protein YndB with AHSA1/START domain